jgi:hypothetical protein
VQLDLDAIRVIDPSRCTESESSIPLARTVIPPASVYDHSAQSIEKRMFRVKSLAVIPMYNAAEIGYR